MTDTITRPEVRDAATEMQRWFDSVPAEYAALVFRLLASLPGGDRLEDLGYEPYDFLGWKEIDMLGELINAIQDKRDVEEVVELFLEEDEE